MTERTAPDPDEPQASAGLRERLRHGQTDLDEAIALLRGLDLGETPPAAAFDPSWPEEPK